MNQKYPIKAFDGTNTADVSVLNLPAGSVGANGEIDLGLGNPVPKVYRALLTQTGTDAPVATVLENTLGENPVQTFYSEPGTFRIQIPDSVPVFTANKTFVTITDNSELVSGGTILYQVTARRVDVDQIAINTAAADFADTITLANGILNASIQILVYP